MDAQRGMESDFLSSACCTSRTHRDFRIDPARMVHALLLLDNVPLVMDLDRALRHLVGDCDFSQRLHLADEWLRL